MGHSLWGGAVNNLCCRSFALLSQINPVEPKFKTLLLQTQVSLVHEAFTALTTYKHVVVEFLEVVAILSSEALESQLK